jgi:hypothetical protein
MKRPGVALVMALALGACSNGARVTRNEGIEDPPRDWNGMTKGSFV